jgi:hypothetical protein
MPKIPRWLRFRLSTVLILTVIAAWVMATRPIRHRIVWVGDFSCPGEWDEFNPHFLAPTTALALFLTWKAGWAIAARRRNRRESGAAVPLS